MKTYLASAALAALAIGATPAAAQTTGTPSGARVEALVGYDSLRVDLNEFGIDDDLRDNDVMYGIGAGYDFAVSPGVSAGVDLEYTQSNNKRDFDDGEENVEISTGRDLYAGGRVSLPISDVANVYAKAGYTNLQVTGESAGVDDKVNLDGYRVGAGAQFAITRGAYVGGEYRFSDYEEDVTRHQFAVTLGTRF